RGDRHLHPEVARARADGPAGADLHQVDRHRGGAHPPRLTDRALPLDRRQSPPRMTEAASRSIIRAGRGRERTLVDRVSPKPGPRFADVDDVVDRLAATGYLADTA